MPPKKDKGKDKKDTGETDGKAALQMLQIQYELLQRQLAERTDRALGAEKVANELRAKMRQMESDMMSNERTTFDITAEMTRQYKAMQENLMGKIGNLESEIHRLKDELAASKALLADTIREKDSAIMSRDEEIERMKVKMEDMAAEFGDMLAETLRKMGERVELAAATWEGDASGGVPIIRKMEEFAATNK